LLMCTLPLTIAFLILYDLPALTELT